MLVCRVWIFGMKKTLGDILGDSDDGSDVTPIDWMVGYVQDLTAHVAGHLALPLVRIFSPQHTIISEHGQLRPGRARFG